jgi:hypothetical protein
MFHDKTAWRCAFFVGKKYGCSKVERDFQVLGVRRWRELVIDRDKWRGIVRQDKAHSGL